MLKIATNQLLILDTNVLVHLLRNNAIGQAIENTFSLTTRPERPLLSSIVEGELRGLATLWKWGPVKIANLEKAFSELVRVSAGTVEVTKAYGELYAHQISLGRKIGENDLWIAATAVAVRATLLTCDSDFKHLDPKMVSYVHFAA